MKKPLLFLLLSFIFLTAFGLDALSQPIEVTESDTTTYYVPWKAVPLGADSAFMNYDGTGLTVSDTGQGLFHQATAHVMGSLTIMKGKWEDERGAGIWTLINGDKVFFTIKGSGQVAPPGVAGIAKGTVTIVGGTGKCSGIEGTFEYTRYSLPTKPGFEGIVQSYTKANIKYRLP